MSVGSARASVGAMGSTLVLARRAASVQKWLVDKGIDRKRLSAKGIGEERPVDSNDTEEGRQNNRRVEFHILEMNGKPVESGGGTVEEKPGAAP